MSDILADYRIWKSQQEERIGTHSKRCHLWPRHERCMIHRLAAEVERLRDLADKRGSIAVKRRREIERLRLTDAERRAIADAADRYAEITPESAETAATLRGLLERHFPAPENPPEQDNCPPSDEKLPSGNDAPNLHSNHDEVSVPCTFTAQTEH